ncbi:MAG: hypothetical protein ABIS70_10575, partial [Actinomycetota bacterium]
GSSDARRHSSAHATKPNHADLQIVIPVTIMTVTTVRNSQDGPFSHRQWEPNLKLVNAIGPKAGQESGK